METIAQRIRATFTPDRAMQGILNALIRRVEENHRTGRGEARWKRGEKLRLLMAGYLGTRNTGADVRVEEMVRQIRHIFGDENLHLTMITLDPSLTSGYFEKADQVLMPQIFMRWLARECPKHHGVVACEGSMFKSKFADALSVFMASALGMAAAEDKLSVGYGAEAGPMNPNLTRFVERHCRKSFVVCRNEPSRDVLTKLGIRSAGGTDTAWTFDPGPLERGRRYLREAGWDGVTPVLAVCPINPFWWPVKPALLKAGARKLFGAFKDDHYKSIYFHEYTDEAKAKYRTYLAEMAKAVTESQKEAGTFVVLVGMERLDRRACEDLSRALGKNPPLFVSDTYDMYEMVSVLRNASYVVSSRFHAVVTSMPGLVPSAGVTMDERIRNLMVDRGHEHLLLDVDARDLGGRLLEILRTLRRDRERIADEIGRTIPRQLEKMGEMGIEFLDEVYRVYPEFPKRDLPRAWQNYLPPLCKDLRDLMEKYA